MPVDDYIMGLKPSTAYEQRIGGKVIVLIDTQCPLVPFLLPLQDSLTCLSPNHSAAEINCPRVAALGREWTCLVFAVKPSKHIHPADLTAHNPWLVMASLDQNTQEELEVVDAQGSRIVVRPGDFAVVEEMVHRIAVWTARDITIMVVRLWAVCQSVCRTLTMSASPMFPKT